LKKNKPGGIGLPYFKVYDIATVSKTIGQVGKGHIDRWIRAKNPELDSPHKTKGNSREEIGQTQATRKRDSFQLSLFSPYITINSRWFTDLNIKP
jgi:hypothetical protein